MKFSSKIQNEINLSFFLFKLKITYATHPKATQWGLWFGQLKEPQPRGRPAAGNLIQECLFLLYGKSKQMMNRATQRSRNVLFFLFSYVQDKTWNEVMETHQKLPVDQLDLRKQQEAMWELFTSECTYFLDHLLVLKMVMPGLIFVVDGQY